MFTHSYTDELSISPSAFAFAATVRLSPNAPTTLMSSLNNGRKYEFDFLLQVGWNSMERHLKQEGGRR